jgi:arylsulfatase A-like enzyme
MSDHAGVAVEALTEGAVNKTVAETPPGGTSARIVLLVAVWFGLIAGFVDAGLLVVNTRLIARGFYHEGSDFAWIIPTGVAVLVLIPAIVIAVIARIRRGRIRLGWVVGVLTFVGFLDVCARLPLYFWASSLICGGLSMQLVRFVRPRGLSFLRLVRMSVPLLVGIVVATFLLTQGGRAWSEYRQTSALPPAPSSAQNVLLIVWDTVRTGNMSLYGYRRPTTPNLERLAGRGARFDLAFSTSSWTLPAHASLFTGRWPHELGVGWQTPMRDDVLTLAEYLAAHGYDTAGFAANLDYCSRETGLARGFAHYEDYPIDVFDAFIRNVALMHRVDFYSWAFVVDAIVEKCTRRWYDLVPRSKEHAKKAEAVDRSFLRWLSRRKESGRPFFAFLNYNDAHSPYEVADPSTAGFGLRPASSPDRYTLFQLNSLDKARLSDHDVRMLNDVYDDCISYLDRRVGLMVEELSQRGVLENTLVIVTSDHGEHLGDHLLFFHGCSLYRQIVQVPLVIVGTKGVPPGRTIGEPVSLCDIPATIVDLLGFGRDGSFPGRSVARYWNHPDQSAAIMPEPLFMETIKPEVLANQGREPAAKGPMKSIVAGGMHYIQTADGLEELYVLESDPEEKSNVASASNAQPVLERLRAALGLVLKKGRQPEAGVKTGAERKTNR